MTKLPPGSSRWSKLCYLLTYEQFQPSSLTKHNHSKAIRLNNVVLIAHGSAI